MKPICSIAYLVPKLYQEMFRKGYEHLFLLGLLEIANNP